MAQCRSAALCQNIGIVAPKKGVDVIKDPQTVKRVHDNNVAIEEGCL